MFTPAFRRAVSAFSDVWVSAHSSGASVRYGFREALLKRIPKLFFAYLYPPDESGGNTPSRVVPPYLLP